MIIDKRKILIKNLGDTGSININLTNNFFPVDNSELIKDKFVEDEVKKSINPIIDYKKVMFKPTDNNWNIITKFKINLNFYTRESIKMGSPLHRGTGSQPGIYSDLGFIFDDLFCRTSRFINSFLRISFFDKPYSGNNNLLSFTDIFTQVGKEQENEFGITLPADQSPISFVVGDPILESNEVHEGYQFYWFKDLVDNSPNMEYELYMVLQFYNSLNGRVYDMVPSKDFSIGNVSLNTLEGEKGILYLKVILKNDNGIYKYKFTPNVRQLLVPPGVNLNPTNGDYPSLTFFQLTP
jgi:hypothetical protein